jgi:hypothetical protein
MFWHGPCIYNNYPRKMNDIIENNDGQFANGQISGDLRLNSDATQPETQLEAVNVIELCTDAAREEYSASEHWERERQRRGSQFLPQQIDADEQLPGYLREPHLPRFESRSARNFARRHVHQEDPLSVLSPQSNADRCRRTSESDRANTGTISPSLNAIC